MAQADGVVANASGAAVRSDLNDQLAAVFTTHSGASSPSTTYAYQLWADTTANELKIRNSANDAWISLRGLDGSLTIQDGSVGAPGLSFTSDPNTGIYRSGADAIAFSTGGTKRLEIKDLGTNQGDNSLLWGTNVNPHTNYAAGIQFSQAGTIRVGNLSNCLTCNSLTPISESTSGTGLLISFRHTTTEDGAAGNIGTGVGGITHNTTSTSYGTTSDYRLKENVVALTGAKARLNSLDVKRFNFIKNPSLTVDGFLAHEVGGIVPEAITGTKDEVDESGSPVYQNIDQAKLVPLLTAALQEAFAEIAALTARVETLEAG